MLFPAFSVKLSKVVVSKGKLSVLAVGVLLFNKICEIVFVPKINLSFVPRMP